MPEIPRRQRVSICPQTPPGGTSLLLGEVIKLAVVDRLLSLALFVMPGETTTNLLQVHIPPDKQYLPDLATILVTLVTLVTLVSFDGHLLIKHQVTQALF